MARIEHFRDSNAPVATRVAPAVFAVVRDRGGAVLLVRRGDSGNWEPPGGHIDPGETPSDALAREVAEESGLLVKTISVAGVYSDPDHVMVYPASGEIRQQFAVWFHAAAIDGELRCDGIETVDAAWIPPERLAMLPVHPVVRSRLQQVLADPDSTHI